MVCKRVKRYANYKSGILEFGLYDPHADWSDPGLLANRGLLGLAALDNRASDPDLTYRQAHGQLV